MGEQNTKHMKNGIRWILRILLVAFFFSLSLVFLEIYLKLDKEAGSAAKDFFKVAMTLSSLLFLSIWIKEVTRGNINQLKKRVEELEEKLESKKTPAS